jgi:hypothetical protein
MAKLAVEASNLIGCRRLLAPERLDRRFGGGYRAIARDQVVAKRRDTNLSLFLSLARPLNQTSERGNAGGLVGKTFLQGARSCLGSLEVGLQGPKLAARVFELGASFGDLDQIEAALAFLVAAGVLRVAQLSCQAIAFPGQFLERRNQAGPGALRRFEIGG